MRGVDKCVFTGDTIFVGGCGRFFEGSAAEMAQAMAVMRDRLPQDTKMFCGHEYSEQNMNFCKLADPANPVVAAKAAENAALLAAGWFSVPSTISAERTFNVFMRCFDTDMQEQTGTTDPVSCIAFLRLFKNNGTKPTPAEIAKL